MMTEAEQNKETAMPNEVKTLFENDNTLSDEAQETIAAMYHSAVDEGVARELSEAMELMRNELRDELVGQLDEYLHEEFGRAVEELSEAVEGVASMIVTLADCGDAATRARFYARAAKDADQSERPDNANHYTSANQDGSHGVSGSDRNKRSLKPGQGITYGTQGIREETEGTPELPAPYMNHLAKMELAALEKQTLVESADDDREAREALRDHLHAVEQARKDQYHARLMEYIERKEEQSRGVLRG